MKPQARKLTQTSKKAKPLTQAQVGAKYGFRSGLEERIGQELTDAGFEYEFEPEKIPYVKPERKSTYTYDFRIKGKSFIIESKGRFLTADRQKHLLVKHQHPDRDIRFVFSNSKARISKQSSTTYADWCNKHGFKYADKSIPMEWLNE